MEMVSVSLHDSLRAYIRVRRDLLKYTQQAFARAIGMPYPTYRDWETPSAPTKELKSGPYSRAIDLLDIPSSHIKRLAQPDTTTEEAERLAAEMLTDYDLMTPRSEAEALVAREYQAARRHARFGEDPEVTQLRKQAEELIDALAHSPRKLDRWVAYGRGQLESD